MTWFDDLAGNVGLLIGADAVIGGFLLGLFLTAGLAIPVLALLRNSGNASLLMAAIGMAFSVIVGWWPEWTVLFAVFVVVVLIVRPFERSGTN